jgi:hypothetical protein
MTSEQMNFYLQKKVKDVWKEEYLIECRTHLFLMFWVTVDDFD